MPARELYHYQQKVLDWAQSKNKIALFLEMRLGKTIIAIRWLQQKNPTPSRILIISPLSVVNTWLSELNLEGIEPIIINTKLTNDPVINKPLSYLPGWFITNYECITFSDISTYQWDAVILDESPRIKSPTTKISKAICADFIDIPNKAVLTGTPAPETPLDYFQQLKFLNGKMLGCESYYEFKNRYFWTNFMTRKIEPYSKKAKEQITNHVADHAYVLKREHVDIGSKKIYETRYVEMEGQIRSEYDKFEKDWLNESFETKWAIVAFNFMRQMTGGFPQNKPFKSDHKIKEVKVLLSSELKNEQVVIWCWHKNEIKELYNQLKYKYISEYITGETPTLDREKYRLRFQKKHIQILICQIKTASMGIDLSAADTAINYSKSYSGMDNLQIEDRLIHPTKKKPLLFIDIITKNSYDEDLQKAILAKVSSSSEFLKIIHNNMHFRHEKKRLQTA